MYLVCGPPIESTIEFGSIEITETSYEVGTRLDYVCDEGFDTRNRKDTVCRASFLWSRDVNGPPVCRLSKY